MASVHIPNKIVCKVFLGLERSEGFQILTRTQGTHLAKSIKVKSLKTLKVLPEFVACSSVARVLPSEVTAPVDSLSALALLSFHFSNVLASFRSISVGISCKAASSRFSSTHEASFVVPHR